MPKLQDYTIYTPDNQITDLAERQGMRVHLITGPTSTCYARRTPSTSLGRSHPYATWTTPAT